MADQERPQVDELEVRDLDDLDSVVVRQRPFGAMFRAAASSPALALAALITATATILTMSAASEIADAKLDSGRGFNNLEALRWASGTRLLVAVIAVLLSLLASIRYSRDLPATRYTFADDGDDVTESIEGVAAPGWLTMLLGAACVVSVLAVVLNAVALAFALHLNESPNFGIPAG